MDYHMPSKDQFPNSAPRYPNVWFYVHHSLCGTYREAKSFVWSKLEQCAEMLNDFGIDHNAEGCDAFSRRRGLQPIRLGENGELNHDHSLHIRFYFSAIASRQHQPAIIGGEPYFQLAASVHYEVDRPRHLHPYEDSCPYCGCTGEYGAWMGSGESVKNERVHDPLGVEALLYGTVRGEQLIAFDGLNTLARDYKLEIEQLQPYRDDMNTAVIGRVWISAK